MGCPVLVKKAYLLYSFRVWKDDFLCDFHMSQFVLIELFNAILEQAER